MRIGFLMLSWVVLALAGCSQTGLITYQVSGTVTWKEDPLPDGYIVFEAKDGKAHAAAGKITNGEFSFRSTAGPKIVRIMANREKPGQTNKVMGLREKEQYLPEKYNVNTELQIKVTADGDNRFTFDLKE